MNTTKIRTGGANFAKGDESGGWAEYDCLCGEVVRAEGKTLQQARAMLCTAGPQSMVAHIRANPAAH